MADDASTIPELSRAFQPRPGFQLMYIAPVFGENWNGDICATIPHTAPYTPDITLPDDDYSVKVTYCDDNLTPSGTCQENKTRMVLEDMIYAIAHPGDDGAFQSRIVGNTLYVPSEGNDDLVRYLSIRDAYDMGDCDFRVARVPKQDPRYHNEKRTGSVTRPAEVRTWTTVAENVANTAVHSNDVSSCTTRLSTNPTSRPYDADGLTTLGGTNRYGSHSTALRYDYVESCTKVRLEYPVNRYGETYASEKCCIELNRTGLPAGSFTSNCQLAFNTGCADGTGNELNGETPYIFINTSPFVNAILGPVPTSSPDDNAAQRPIAARLKIEFRNGNRLYRIDDNATIFRVETWPMQPTVP
jgi:hypothetical protein